MAKCFPSAVLSSKSTVLLQNGTAVPDALLVDKDQLYLEGIGATQELYNEYKELKRKVIYLISK